MENQSVNHQNEVEEGKTTAIVSYFTWIGTVIAYFMNNSKKNSFASFHIRQMIGLSIISILNSFVYNVSGTVGGVISIGLFVLWIIGFIGAVKGEKKLVPVLGEHFQNWFKGI